MGLYHVAQGYHRIRSEFGDRFLLGIGAGHPEVHAQYERPYAKLTDYLDRLDDAGVPARDRILAARQILGPGPLLAAEHKVVVSADPAHARSIGRPMVRDPYLSLRNYTNNLLREGFTSGDIADGGSDRLIDSLVLHGTPRQIGIQVIADPGETPLAGFRTLAEQLRTEAAR